MRITWRVVFAVCATVAFSFCTANALNAQGRGRGGRGEVAELSAAQKAINKAADALGMLRSINRIDAINTMEFWGNGTSTMNGQSAPTDFHVSVGYNPPGMRAELTRTVGGAKQLMITEVTDKYAWNEDQVGGGLVPGKGTATPDTAAFKARYMELWTFPYGAIKAAVMAGDMAKLSNENGVATITFPLMGPLAGVTETITLDAKNLVSKVETKSSDPALNTVSDYSGYADMGDIKSDVEFPGRVVITRGGKPYVDMKMSKDDPNNPYIIFPVPANVKSAQ